MPAKAFSFSPGLNFSERHQQRLGALGLAGTLGLALAGWLLPDAASRWPGLSPALLLNLVLLALAQTLLKSHRHGARTAALMAASLSLWLLLGGAGAAQGAGPGMERPALALWLLLASLASWSLCGQGAARTALGLLLVALCTTASASAGGLALIRALLPGPELAAAPSLDAAVLAVLAGLNGVALANAWAQVARHERERPQERYRWLFARQLALLLSTSMLAGLVAIGLTRYQAIAQQGPGPSAGALGWTLASVAALALAASAWSCWRQLPRWRELQLALQQVEQALSQLPLAALTLDESQRIVQLNAAAMALLDEPAEPLGAPLQPYLSEPLPPPGTRQRTRLRARGGALVPVELQLSPLRRLGPPCLQLLLRDLRPEQRDAEALLRWKRVFDESGWGMAIVSTDSQPLIEQANPAYAELLGHGADELRGQALLPQVAPALRARLCAMRAAAARGQHTVQGQLQLRRCDGSTLPCLVTLSAVRADAGQLLYFLLCVQDISTLQAAQDAAQQHATQLRAVLDALPLGVWIGTASGSLWQTNPAARQMWSLDREPAAAVQAHEALLRRAVQTGRQLAGEPFELPQPDGSSRSLLTIASPIREARSGQIVGALAIDEDLSGLRQHELALRRSHELLERVLQSCAMGIALVDAQGRILRRNPAWSMLLAGGNAATQLQTLLDPADPLLWQGLLTRIAHGEQSTHVGEHRLRRHAGQLAWTLLVVTRVAASAADAPQLLVQVMDVDERRRASDEIVASHLRLAVAQRIARVGDWQWWVERDLFSCSKQMLDMLGLPPGAGPLLSRAALLELVEPQERASLAAALGQALSLGGMIDQDVCIRRADGQPLIAHLHGVLQRSAAGGRVDGTLQDVTERKRIEAELRRSRERLRELMNHESQLIEEERKRIAREVHDELGQLLTALRMDLSLLRAELPSHTPAAQRTVQMRDTMGRMAEVVRHIAANLRPAALDLGLVAAIEWLAEDFSLRWETQVELNLPQESEPALDESVALALFRAVQESLTNIAKHARASQVRIELSLQGPQLLLRVSDNGRGFDAEAVSGARRGGLGLLGMRERMHAVGAELQIRSSPGGSVIEIRYRAETRPPGSTPHEVDRCAVGR